MLCLRNRLLTRRWLQQTRLTAATDTRHSPIAQSARYRPRTLRLTSATVNRRGLVLTVLPERPQAVHDSISLSGQAAPAVARGVPGSDRCRARTRAPNA